MTWKEVVERALVLGATVSYDKLFDSYQIMYRNFRIYTSCGMIQYTYSYYDDCRDETVQDSTVVVRDRTPEQVIQFLEVIKYED